MREKNHLLLSSFNIRKTYLQSCTRADSYPYTNTHLRKDTTFSHSLASTGRELQPPSSCTSDMFTSTQALTYRRIKPSLISQLLLERNSNTLALVLADPFTSTQAPAYRRLQPSLFSSRDYISFIFRLDTLGTQHHILNALFHQIFILDPSTKLNLKINHH